MHKRLDQDQKNAGKTRENCVFQPCLLKSSQPIRFKGIHFLADDRLTLLRCLWLVTGHGGITTTMDAVLASYPVQMCWYIWEKGNEEKEERQRCFCQVHWWQLLPSLVLSLWSATQIIFWKQRRSKGCWFRTMRLSRDLRVTSENGSEVRCLGLCGSVAGGPQSGRHVQNRDSAAPSYSASSFLQWEAICLSPKFPPQ